MNGDYLYEDVYLRSWDLAQGVIDLLGDSCTGRHVALLCPGGLGHVISVWSCWLSGHVAVPLCPSSDQVNSMKIQKKDRNRKQEDKVYINY